ncbi:SGNH/GDSL hydrolase family protein [Streptomyces sp. NPDC091292]|uniref:SGNH/GDSL hydrolase family protein n=1 Tax=Streptomyces sp. NPDC091292 TaxID=3365991 RepID=UPI003819CAC1
MSLRSAGYGLAALAVTVSLTGLAAPAQAAEDTETLNYVALGDSYAAGSGVLPLAPSAPLLCLRSSKNYPQVIAAATNAKLTDVTCGGAGTRHFENSQYPGVAPQLNALTADTDLVTVTIGGNDSFVFAGAVVACGSAGVLSAGKGSPCKNTWGSHFDRLIEEKTYPAVRTALQKIKAKAPNARVVVVDYPWLLPAQADKTCFAKMPIAEGDVPYLRSMQGHMNKILERAANETGASYADMADASDGHDSCQPRGVRWVDPMFFFDQLNPVHPNALGESKMASEAMRALNIG